jgi:hypothetical protein
MSVVDEVIAHLDIVDIFPDGEIARSGKFTSAFANFTHIRARLL